MFRPRSKKVVSLLLILMLYILITASSYSTAQAMETGSSDKPQTESVDLSKAEVLLIYGSDLSEAEKNSLDEIVKALTYLQHSVVYLPYDQCKDLIDQYSYIICYNLGTEANSLMDEIASQRKAVMMLGGEAVLEYVKTSGLSLRVEKSEDLAVSLEYSFSEKNSTAALIRLQNSFVLEGDFYYQSGTLSFQNKSVGLYSKKETFLYTPCYDLTNEILAAVFANETAKWIWPFQGPPHIYSQYLVLDEVYPFLPPEQLLDIVNYIIAFKIPFVISVMPIYQNGDYPAMERFCEVLRYAQANGAAIILHAPNTVRQEDYKDQLWEYYTYATKAYTSYGIYPLAIEVPEKFLYNQIDRDIIKRYTTIFCYREDGSDGFDLGEQYNKVFYDGHLLIAPSYRMNQEKNSPITSLASAAYFDLTEGMDKTKEAIYEIVNSEVFLKNLWDIDQNVYGNDIYISTKNGEVFFNDEKVFLDYTPFTYKKYKYKSGVFQWIAQDITGLNHQLAFIVVISSVIFIIIIIIGRHHNRRKYLIPKKKRG